MEFEFNIKKGRRTLIVFLSSSLVFIFLILLTNNKLRNSYFASWELVTTFFVFYLSLASFFFKRLFNSYKSKNYLIRIEKDKLSIPTFHLGQKKISIQDVYSVENLLLRDKVLGVILGLKDKGRYLIEKERFLVADDFDVFAKKINEIVSARSETEENSIISKVISKKEKNNAYVSYIVFIIAIIIYFLGSGGSIDYSGNTDFLLLGGNTKSTFQNFEIYRVSASSFLHISIIHLLLNLLMLGLFSELLERLLSVIRFANLYFFSGFFAVLASSLFSSFEGSLGASGALFGLWGGYTFLRVKYDKYLPGSINTIPLSRLYFLLLLEIFIEVLLIKNIDYINHLGGFIAGFLYLYFVPLGDKLETIDHPAIYEKGLFAILVSFYSIGLSYFLLLYYGLI